MFSSTRMVGHDHHERSVRGNQPALYLEGRAADRAHQRGSASVGRVADRLALADGHVEGLPWRKVALAAKIGLTHDRHHGLDQGSARTRPPGQPASGQGRAQGSIRYTMDDTTITFWWAKRRRLRNENEDEWTEDEYTE